MSSDALLKSQKHPTERRRRTRSGSAIDSFVDLVGVLQDREVAERAGTTTGAVAQFRRRFGIPAAFLRGGRTRNPEAADRLTAAIVTGLVAAPADAESVPTATSAQDAAAEQAVATAHRAPRSDPAPAPGKAASRAQLHAYRVEVEGQEGGYLVVAAGIADAAVLATAKLAVHGLGGRVVGMRWLGDAIG